MQFCAGAGAGPISFPETFFPIEGFRGVHDAPMARILLLEAGEKLALIALELVMLPPELVEQVQREVETQTGFPAKCVWVHTTHAITTPHAPHAPMGPGGVPLPLTERQRRELEGKNRLYAEAVMTAVKTAAREAREHLGPAGLGYGECFCAAGINRDIETPYGWWLGENPEGPTNDRVQLLRLENVDGRLIAAVVNADWKPCTIDNSQMAEGQRLVSSDAPGLLCRQAEGALGAPCLFLMGAAGDQVPVEQALQEQVDEKGRVSVIDLGVEAGLAMVSRLGSQMAEAVIPALKDIRCRAVNGTLAAAEGAFSWPQKGRMQLRPQRSAQFVPEGETTVAFRTAALEDLALVGLKPEINCVTGQQLRAASPYGRTMIFAMVNGGQKYMPDAKSYERLTWEAQNSMLMPGGAEAWVREATNLLNKVKGECDDGNSNN